jgi:serine/threonine protein kinase
MMNALRAVNEEPIPGYRLLAPLGCGGFGEVWKCEVPGGLYKAIKFVKGSDDAMHPGGNGAAQELRALQHIKSIRHPFLLSIERLEIIGQDLLIVMELADRSLHDLLEDARREDRAGLPRNDVLAYLREAAEVLDLMNLEHGLQHLDVKPRNLFLVGRHVKVADFGLVNSLNELYGEDGQDRLRAITPLYAAPETYQGQVSLFSDQYSLAVTYHELLTGELPFAAKTLHQLADLVANAPPDLERVSISDRPVLRRALSKAPRERYPSCTALIEALEAAGGGLSGGYPVVRARPTAHGDASRELATTTVFQSDKSNNSGSSRGESRMGATVRVAGGNTEDGPLPGYQLKECLGRGPAGEVWRALGPRNDPRLVRFLARPEASSSHQNPLDRLLGLRHENLPEMEMVPIGGDRVALICEAGETSLFVRLKECQAAGQPGIPRSELLASLAQAADALDKLYQLYQVQHLALTPRHLASSAGRMILLDFGLAELVWLPGGIQPATLNARYAAPELFTGEVGDACDQYSLALLFQEMLVGLHPLRTLNTRQLASPRLRGQPDVSMLPALDRPIILRALDPEPEKRFRSCREFILALEEATPGFEPALSAPSRHLADNSGPPVSSSQSASLPAEDHARITSLRLPALTTGVLPAVWRSAIDELVQAAGRGQEIRSAGVVHYRFASGSHIEHRCLARLAPGMARLKMDGFREKWKAESILRSDGRFVMEVPTAGTLLQRCLGRVPGLIVDVCVGAPRERAGNLRPIRITIQPSACGRGQAEQLLSEMGPHLLASLNTYLHSQSDRTAQERFPLGQVVYVQPAAATQGINTQMRDVGRDGLCLYSPSPLPVGAVTLSLNRLGSPVTVQVPGWVRDCFPHEDRFEVEVAFAG